MASLPSLLACSSVARFARTAAVRAVRRREARSSAAPAGARHRDAASAAFRSAAAAAAPHQRGTAARIGTGMLTALTLIAGLEAVTTTAAAATVAPTAAAASDTTARLTAGTRNAAGTGTGFERVAEAGSLAPAPTGAAVETPQNLAPYVPTPQDVVDRMLEMAQVTQTDVVYDIGCGDGRIVITAAKKYGARGVGIDIDPARIAEAKAAAEKAGVAGLVEFRQQDALQADVAPASVVMLSLLPSFNMKLRPLLTKQLKAGSRVVSLQFDMGNWAPAKRELFTDANGATRPLYLWVTDGTAH